MPLVFVYGSLRKGLANHTKLRDAVYKGPFRTKEDYYMIGLKSKAYPYVTSEKLHESLTHTHITGELYEVSEDLLAELDILEGHPTNYTRTRVALEPLSSKGASMEAWMYVLTNAEIQTGIARAFDRRFVAVPTGDWVVHLDS